MPEVGAGSRTAGLPALMVAPIGKAPEEQGTVPELLLTHPGGKPGLQAAKVWGQEGSEVPGASSRSSPLSGLLLVSG